MLSFSSIPFREGRGVGIQHEDAADDTPRAGKVPELLGAGRGVDQGRLRAEKQVHLLHHEGRW